MPQPSTCTVLGFCQTLVAILLWLTTQASCSEQTGILVEVKREAQADITAATTLRAFVGFTANDIPAGQFSRFSDSDAMIVQLAANRDLADDPYRFLFRRGQFSADALMVAVVALDADNAIIGFARFVRPVRFIDGKVVKWTIWLSELDQTEDTVTVWDTCVTWSNSAGRTAISSDEDTDCDGVTQDVDRNDENPFACSDVDLDSCEDCFSGGFAPNQDGPDANDDGQCDPVMKTVGIAPGRDFPTITAWEQTRQGGLTTRRILAVTGTSSEIFAAGELVQGPGCSGTYIPEDFASTNGIRMTLDNFFGDCSPNSTLTGQSSGASATFHKVVMIGTTETAVLYDDAIFTENVVIDGSTTDTDHYMHITVDPESRHGGIAGSGVVIDPPESAHGIQILDHHTRVDGVEITDWTTSVGESVDGINVMAHDVLIENVLIHDDGHGAATNSDANGITVELSDITVTVRNSIVYNIARQGIGIHIVRNATLFVENCTVFRCVEADSVASSYGCIGVTLAGDSTGSVVHVINTIALGSSPGSGGNFVMDSDSMWGTVASNMSDDGSAPGSALMSVAVDTQFVSTTRGLEDLHLSSSSDAHNAGQNLSDDFSTDIDGESRANAPDSWDIGADEQ